MRLPATAVPLERLTGTRRCRAVAAVVATCVGACGQGRPDALSVVPGSAALGQGETVTFSVGGNELVRWSVREGATNAGTIDQSGRYTAPITPGTYHVVATAVDGDRSGEAVVIVFRRDLVYRGGWTLNAPIVYVIAWGKAGAFPADGLDAVASFAGGLRGSPYLRILDQYVPGVSSRFDFRGVLIDEANAPSTINPYDEVFAETCHVLAANAVVPTMSTIAIVVGAPSVRPAPGEGVLCGWHWFTVCSGVEMPVAYVSGAICESALTGCNGLSKGAMAMLDTTAHELFEIVTDPWPVSGLAGWLDPAGNEIGDKCEPDGPQCVTLASGTFLLPTMYSNARHSCVVE